MPGGALGRHPIGKCGSGWSYQCLARRGLVPPVDVALADLAAADVAAVNAAIGDVALVDAALVDAALGDVTLGDVAVVDVDLGGAMAACRAVQAAAMAGWVAVPRR